MLELIRSGLQLLLPNSLAGGSSSGGGSSGSGGGSGSLGGEGKIPYLPLYLGFSIGVSLFDTYLSYRQYQKNKSKKIPPQIQGLVSEEHFQKTQVYQQDKRRFGFVEDVVSLVEGLAMTGLFVAPALWRASGALLGSHCNEYTQSLLFSFLQTIFGKATSWPFRLYYDFVIEDRHGFNKKTVKLFWLDELKSFLISMLLGPPILAGLIWVIRWGGKHFYFYVWAFSMTIGFAMMYIYPNYIQPLFNKLEPVKDEELKEKIHKLAASIQFPLTKLLQMDGSKRSSHSNAYMYGFWKNKRIVLFDTLLKQPHEEILAILGHELGHWKLSHMIQNMIWASVNMLIMFYLYGQVMYHKELFDSFGYYDTTAVVVGLTLFSNIYSPISFMLGLLQNLISRTHERQADTFAYSLGYGKELQSALKAVHANNLGELNPDSWYAWFNYSHPSLVERLALLERLQESHRLETDKKKD
eukprot:Filipodium_phascolosomae@DN1369_c0_g1_i1.p1